MEAVSCFISFSALIVIIVVLVGFASKAQARADRWNRAYHALAQRYGGQCMPAGWFGYPSVRFQYGATHVLINTYKAGNKNFHTQIHINWVDAHFRLEIYPDWSDIRPRPLRGMQNVDIANEEFEQRYTIRSNSSEETASFLSDGVRWQIDRLRHLHGSDDVYLAIHRGRLLIKKPAALFIFHDLEEFTQLALELYDQSMLTRMVGIEFVEDGVQMINEAICQICGEEITTDMVFCRRCKTPHHLECWQYYGSCAVYGCQEQRYVVPRMAGPPTDDAGG